MVLAPGTGTGTPPYLVYHPILYPILSTTLSCTLSCLATPHDLVCNDLVLNHTRISTILS
jgi:hypothetical protein